MLRIFRSVAIYSSAFAAAIALGGLSGSALAETAWLPAHEARLSPTPTGIAPAPDTPPVDAAEPNELLPDLASTSAALDRETECVAKVVHHEAGNQPANGQLAVAQVVMNRVKSGRFAGTPCAVANQPGQFFSTAAYRPSRATPRWQSAVAMARVAMDGSRPAVISGALFFHAAYAPESRFFRSLTRLGQIGDHVFYR